MGLETAALIAAGAGTAANAYTNWQGNKMQNREIRRRTGLAEQYALPMMEQGDVSGIGALENFLGQFGGGTPGEGFNVGQDALMQMLRADPRTKVHDTLEGLMETGNPFDTSEVFKTLEAVDARKRRGALADVRAGAGGLGERFGSAAAQNESDLVAQLLEQTGARDAQIAMGAHEAAQGRRMGAAQQLSQRELADQGMRTQIGQLLSQLGLQEGDLALRGDQTKLQGLAQLIGGQQQGRQQGLGALSLLMGLPMPGTYGPGGDIMDLSQLLLIANSMRD